MTIHVSRRHMLAMSAAAGGLAIGRIGGASAQAAKKIDQFDPALEKIISTSEPIKELANGFGGPLGPAEGPVWIKEGGYLLFSDINASKRMKYTPGQGVTVFQENTNQANGLTRDLQGRIIACEHETRRQLQRWGINENRLPSESEIRFRAPTASEQYRLPIFLTAAAIILQTALIWWLLFERRYRHRAEAAARDAASELVQMNRLAAAGELTALIAHEINQPLTGIVSNASAVRRLLSKQTPAIDKVLGMVEQIENAGHHASDIIQNIRATLRRDTQDKSSVDVNRLILLVLALGKTEIQKHEVKVKIELDDQLPTVNGNEVQLQQVVLNLVMNAVDAMASVQPRILRIQSHLSKAGRVHVSIEDTGTGIDPADVSRIFKPLFSTKATGMGMGLSICHSIIESHHGQLWVEAGADRGSIFQFELPVV